VTLLLFASLLDVIPPKLIGWAIDDIQFGQMSAQRLRELLLLYGGIIVISYVITYVWMFQLFGGAFLVERILRFALCAICYQ
jgi:ATP-binding cassette subfamily B protein